MSFFLPTVQNGQGAEKAHKFFNINFLHPTREPPPEKNYVPHFLGKNAKKGPTEIFSGVFWGLTNGVPNGPFSATKSLVYCFFFLPLVLRCPGPPTEVKNGKSGKMTFWGQKMPFLGSFLEPFKWAFWGI